MHTVIAPQQIRPNMDLYFGLKALPTQHSACHTPLKKLASHSLKVIFSLMVNYCLEEILITILIKGDVHPRKHTCYQNHQIP